MEPFVRTGRAACGTDAILPPVQSVATEAQQPTPIYNLAGQRLQTPPTKGIYIRNRKKVLAE